MRPGQNGKRPRRGRKPHNFMNRTFDSNGPDVKIRGTAAHIYEKYQALARDANASGDRVSAENYLQHAEHYYRLLNSFQPAAGPNGAFNGRPGPMQTGDGSAQPGVPRSLGDEGEGEEERNDEAEEAEDVRA